MKLITKIRDLFLHPSWTGLFLLVFLVGGIPYIFKKMGFAWDDDLIFYTIVTFITILSFAAYRLIGVEYADRIKIYFPKKNKEPFITRLRKKKWRAIEIIMLLSSITILLVLLFDPNSSGLNGIVLLALPIFIFSSIYLQFKPSQEKEDQVFRLILTQTKLIVYKGFHNLQKTEYHLNNLLASLGPEGQLKLMTATERTGSQNTIINVGELAEEDRAELLDVLLKQQ